MTLPDKYTRVLLGSGNNILLDEAGTSILMDYWTAEGSDLVDLVDIHGNEVMVNTGHIQCVKQTTPESRKAEKRFYVAEKSNV